MIKGGPSRNVQVLSFERDSIDFSKILNHTDRFTVIFSDNDPYVPLQNATIFEEELFAQTFIEYNKGHFSGEDNIKELPIVLEELLKMN